MTVMCYIKCWILPSTLDLPMWPSGQSTWRHMQYSVLRSVAWVQTSARAHPPTNIIISNNSYTRDEQGDNPRQEKGVR